MTDRELINGLRTATLLNHRFHHEDHIRAAWLYLKRWGLLEALRRLPSDLRRFAEEAGQPGLYHETITWTFLLAINERRRQLPAGHSWIAFARQFPELFDWRRFVGLYYSEDLLSSDLPRDEFVLPDRLDSVASRMLG